ncbi:uncharacterized protein LOC114466619 [Gouania willdenowi]|uniref:uncharacterized protein LOC114458675 n=1 Tax=Gouania willdenowi TaxID=441366 RepID=UPI001054B8F3|nr:uncharacterized protein LOC114458675 [Gouania willdenowi]XP_028308004.1 uncharacterized protein LOC114466619 [Gouania willdenowi]
MSSFSLLLLSAALIHTTQPFPSSRGRGGRGLDVSMGEVRRQRRDLQPYEDEMMSYQVAGQGGGANNLYYRSNDWRGRSLEQALQRLVERDQRREEEAEQRAAYLVALLRLLNEARSSGLVGPGGMEVMEEEEDEEEDQGPQRNFQDYDETGEAAQTLLNRMEKLQQSGRDQEVLRRLVARILSSVTPDNLQPVPARPRLRRDLSFKTSGPTHRRSRRSLDDQPLPSPSNAPPLLRVKRLEEEEEEEEEERRAGSRRRRALTFDPQILMEQILDYMRE